MRNFNRIIGICVVSILLLSSVFADAPYEKFHISCKDISKEVLRDAIGILTVYSDKRKPKELKAYSKQGDQFVFGGILKLKEAIPISSFGYHYCPPLPPLDCDSLNIRTHRYPIVASFDRYLCVASHPVKNLRVWINVEDLKEDFKVSILMLEEINSWDGFIDIFCFTESKRRKVYREPKRDSDYFIISPKGELLLKAIEQKDGFIKIGRVDVDFDTYEESIEPIGWIRIRDDEGRLMIWIEDVDLC